MWAVIGITGVSVVVLALLLFDNLGVDTAVALLVCGIILIGVSLWQTSVSDPKECPTCGNVTSSAYCENCGSAVSATVIKCGTCSTRWPISTRYCGDCGTLL